MSVSSNVVKLTAKSALKNNYFKVASICLALAFAWLICINASGMLSIVFGNVTATAVSFILQIFLVLPLLLGVLRYIWRMLNSVADDPKAVFYWFSEKRLYIKAIRFIINFISRIAIWLAIFNIPSIILFVLSKSYIFDVFGAAPPLWTANLGYYSILLRNLSFVLIFFTMLRYYLAPILLVADENIDVSEAMYTSSVISRKSSIDFIGLMFTSSGWILLSFLILPLPCTLPLLLSYYAVHCRFSIAEYNIHIQQSKFNESEFI